ncbi:MAG: cytochrome c peroxidase [Arcobacteraceae bacterium]|jgi:cytochrome c peroxidase|nr:cytochrome c peroxidase [Arcobacteraceae bacterium]
MKKLIPLLLFAVHLMALELISPIEDDLNVDLNKALLGKKLFMDPQLSHDNTISCASCHHLDKGGDDNRQFSVGVNNKMGNINSPTVFNSKYNFVQFWDGRAKDLEEQVLVPLHNPDEMNSNIQEVVEKLKKSQEYKNLFQKVYNDTIKEEYVIDAIVEFEKALITPNSKFDRYLKGEVNILSHVEKEGFELFKSYGCISCHNGVNIGGNLFQRVGIVKQIKYENKYLGRYNVTKDEEDKYFYKVPTLRNIELTAPYLHSGEIKTLREAVTFMMEYQIGVTPNAAEVNHIMAFLRTLTGNRPKIMEID